MNWSFILAITIFWASASAIANDIKPKDTLPADLNIHAEALGEFIVHPQSHAFGHTDFFRLATSIDSKNYTKNLTDTRLDQLVKSGKSFRETYLDWLSEGVSELSFDYLTQFEGKVLERIQEIQNFTVPSLKERPYTDQEAIREALQITSERFGLPSSLTLPQLIAGKSYDSIYEEAYYFYQRQFYRNLNKNVASSVPKNSSVQGVLAVLKSEIQQARIENFKNALNFSKQLGSQQQVTFQSPQSKESIIWTSSTDLKIQSMKPMSRAFNLYTINVPPKPIERVKSVFVNWSQISRYDDHSFGQIFFVPPTYSPSWDRSIFDIRLNGTSVFIAEREFSKLFQALRLKNSNNLFGKMRFERRFLIEASQRDALLSDLEAILSETRFSNVEDLGEILRNRIANYQVLQDENNYSLTEEIRSSLNFDEDHFFNNIWWAGLSIHPDFWRLKSQTSHQLGHPHIFESIGLHPQTNRTPPKRGHILNRMKQKRILKDRTSSTAFRSLHRLGRWARNAILIFSIGGGALYTGASHYSGALSLVDSFKKATRNVDRYENSQYYSTKSSGTHGIFDPPKNNDKAFIVSPKQKHLRTSDLPKYFNLLDTSNLPEAVLLDSDPYSEPSQFVETIETSYKDPFDADFKAASKIHTLGSQGRFAILSLPGFKTLNVHVKNEKGNSISNFKLYEVKTSGLTYIEISDPEGVDFITYDAYYKKDLRKVQFPEELISLNPQMLSEILTELSELGASEAVGNLSHQLKSGLSFSVIDLAQSFSSSAFYSNIKMTSSIENWTNALKHSENHFSEFLPYLFKGAFYYQCTGSNSLLQAFLSLYLEKTNSDLEVQSVFGYAHQEGNGYVMASDQHEHTLVTHKTQDRSWTYIDATPSKMNPLEQQTPPNPWSKPKPKPLQKTNSIQQAVLPRPISIEKNKTTNLDLINSENKSNLSKPPERNWSQELQLKSEEQGKFVESEVPDDLQKINSTVQLAGINLGQLINIIQSIHSGNVNVKTGLIQMAAFNAGYRGNIRSMNTSENPSSKYNEKLRNYIDQLTEKYQGTENVYLVLIDEYRKKWNQQLQSIEESMGQKHESLFSFLISLSWRKHVNETLDFLKSVPLPDLIDSNTSKKSCAQLVGKN